MNKIFLLIALVFSFLSQAQNRVTIMTYNVENLFDTEHDQGKSDYTYLPMSEKQGAMRDVVQKYCRSLYVKTWRDQCFDWDYNEEVLHAKMQSLTNVLLQVQGQFGPGPDVVLISEIENVNVFRMWVENYLSEFGYYGFLIDGADQRGIDQAVLSRLHPIGAEPPRMHPFASSDENIFKARRGILEANVWLPDGTPMSLLAVHFPSPGSPRGLREDALNQLNDIQYQLPHGRVVIAGGDMNVTSTEEAKFGPIDSIINPEWMRAELDCNGCLGTYYYKSKNEWSFLDRLFVARHTQSQGVTPWKIQPSSVRVINTAPGQADTEGKPIRFDPMDPNGNYGISDHFPLVFDLYK